MVVSDVAAQGKNTQSIVVIMVLLIALISVGILSYIQSRQLSSLEQEASSLEDEVARLYGNLTDLETAYQNLEIEYGKLNNSYYDLNDSYYCLVESYGALFADRTALKQAFEQPLVNPVIPSIGEVEDWLEIDDTDENEYVDGIWMCGDYAAMLMTRAKTQNWRMRIATAMYSYEGDSGYGSQTDPYGSAGHAFNYIECTDGIWYIEPQSDGIWYFSSGPNKVRMDIHEYYTFPIVGTIWDGDTIWVNFYGDFT